MTPKPMIVIVCVVLFLVAVGYGLSQNRAFKESYERSFKASFRSSFVASCIGTDKSQQKADACNCMADDSLKQLTVKEMSDMQYAMKYIREFIMPQCLANSGISAGEDPR